MKVIYNYFLLIRPLNVLVSGLAMVISAAILDSLNQELLITLIVLVVITYTAGANSINDVLDLEIDKVNRPSRPIPSKKIKKNKALIFSFFLFSVGSVLSLQLPPNAYFISVVVSMPLMVVYSTHLKSKPLVGNIAVSFIIGLSFIFCGTVLGNVYPMWTPGLLAFSLTLIREITKDIADLEGDQIAKYNTYPIQYGIEGATKLISFLSFVVCLFALVPYFNNIYNDWYLIILLIGVEIPLMVVVILLRKNQTISSATLSSKILKFSTIMGLLAIYTGSL